MPDKLDIVTLEFPASGICFPFQLFCGLLQVAVDIRFLRDHLDLELHRADFQIRDKAVDNALLFSGAS